MNKFILLVAALLMSGCSQKMYPLQKHALSEPHKGIEIDDADCKKSAFSQEVSNQPIAGSQPNLTYKTNNKAKEIQAEAYDTCMFSKGWSSTDIFRYKQTYKKETEKQAQAFFIQYPEYLSSPQKEKLLEVAFQKALNDPKNSELDLYQILLVAHLKITEGR
ncbi:hypothetical protein E5C26_20230 [Serratia proteamaculans]|uniref:hypothetical protein n=1 Tax=Serratia proteamaculans TaxID=28151 RepID=UPI0010767D80|nr:hypothetical protein [Serratia proteamaculans]TFZ48670.1 hypothetical protein E5C26_20230 [Serratia proteamaculans]